MTDLTQEKIDLIRDKALEQLTKQLNKEIERTGALNKKKQAKMDQKKSDLDAALKAKFPLVARVNKKVQQKASGVEMKLKILVSLFQMLQGIGITFEIRWPSVYANFLNFLGSIIQLDLPKAMPFDCISNFGFFGSLLMRTLLPIFLIIVLIFSSKLLRSQHTKAADMCSSGWFVLLFLVYPSCSSAVFQAFFCDRLDDGSAYLRVDYSVQCWGTTADGLPWDQSYLTMFFYALVMTLVYPIGTPLLFSALLYANRFQIQTVDRLERNFLARCKVEHGGVEMTEEAEQYIRNKNFQGSILRLTNGYEMRCYWFEVFECVRKLLLIGMPIAVDHGSAAQLILGLFICFLSYGMYASYEPYVKYSDDLLSKICQVSLFFSLVSAIALKMEPDNSAEELGVLLIVAAGVPPVIAFLFESDLDFEEGGVLKHVTKTKKLLLGCFKRTLGSCADKFLRSSPAPEDVMASKIQQGVSSSEVPRSSSDVHVSVHSAGD